ncbi:MAG: hypothetical protein CME62_08475 [Halobacteriovoraceae bacterium]|nr:hypothetical protein [Halobacteriovoraceae bacterium]|tara:strand:- start:8042 stop:8644 length:603 start_codon:yes stop_codon:yes gene_type:complete
MKTLLIVFLYLSSAVSGEILRCGFGAYLVGGMEYSLKLYSNPVSDKVIVEFFNFHSGFTGSSLDSLGRDDVSFKFNPSNCSIEIQRKNNLLSNFNIKIDINDLNTPSEDGLKSIGRVSGFDYGLSDIYCVEEESILFDPLRKVCKQHPNLDQDFIYSSLTEIKTASIDGANIDDSLGTSKEQLHSGDVSSEIESQTSTIE